MKNFVVCLSMSLLVVACEVPDPSAPERSVEADSGPPSRVASTAAGPDPADLSHVAPVPPGTARATRANTGGSELAEPNVRLIACTDGEGVEQRVDPWTNPNHCGGCNRHCCGRFCIEGHCTSDGPAGTTACPLSAEEEQARGCLGDVTVRTSTDPNHCGSCARRCAEGERCEVRECVRR